jgi:hypothetical protein
MALRYSTAALNFFAQEGSLKDAFTGGRIEIYTGTQPASADAAATGTLLCTITNNSLAHTPAVLATGTVTLTAGAAGSVDTVTVNGVNILGAAVPFNATLTQTAADVATAINRTISTTDYNASSAGAVVTIRARRGSGVAPNGLVVAATSTTITTSTTNMAGGVVAVNGLNLGVASAGTIDKDPTQVWSGVNVATGVAGWYRRYSCLADSGALDSAAQFVREDGAYQTSGGELNGSTTFTIGLPSFIGQLATTETTL